MLEKGKVVFGAGKKGKNNKKIENEINKPFHESPLLFTSLNRLANYGANLFLSLILYLYLVTISNRLVGHVFDKKYKVKSAQRLISNFYNLFRNSAFFCVVRFLIKLLNKKFIIVLYLSLSLITVFFKR